MIRPATRDDVPAIVAMVHELASYERATQHCQLTEEQLGDALFGPSPALYAHVAVDDSGETAGFAVWFLNFSTWTGRHGIWLEDLYVRPSARRGGHARALLGELARIARDRGYTRIDWYVLDWNADAHGFYRRIGAHPKDDWIVWRLDGDALRALAGQ